MQVVDARPEHVEQFLSKPIRQDDIDEWFAATGGDAIGRTLRETFTVDNQPIYRALLNDNEECICLWGMAHSPEGFGLVWLIASQEAEQHGKHIHRYWPKEVSLMHMHYSRLVAIAYQGNPLHLSWLEAIGFEPVAAYPVGPGSLPFVTYVRDMPCATQH
jgi:hypothetical protein